MSFDSAASLPLILLGLALLVLAVWLLARAGRTARVVDRNAAATDVLSEGAAKAKRNQALIDAAPSAPLTAANPQATLSAAANTQPVAAATMQADAEAGASAAPPPAAAVPVAAAPAGRDDLARIKGIGPKLVTLLGDLGITSFAQIAAWDEAAIDRIDAQLGRFRGRIRRDQWVQQAQLLADGNDAAHSQKYGQSERE